MPKNIKDPVKQERLSVGAIEESTIYATDLAALKNAIEQARTSAYWHGFYDHKARYLEVENKNLEDRIEHLESNNGLQVIEIKELRKITNQQIGEAQGLRTLLDKGRADRDSMRDQLNEFKHIKAEQLKEFLLINEALKRSNKTLKGQLTKARKLLAKNNEILKKKQ